MKYVNSVCNYSGKFFELYTDKCITDTGKEVNWERCSRKNNIKAVMIVPYHIDLQKFVMISEYRIPIRSKEIGFPAGLIDKPNESIEEVIRRELKEETGLDLVKILTISPFVYSTAGMTDESIAIAYVQVNGEPSKNFLQETEEITTFMVSKEQLANLLKYNNANWGAKAWIICNNIVNPNPFNIE